MEGDDEEGPGQTSAEARHDPEEDNFEDSSQSPPPDPAQLNSESPGSMSGLPPVRPALISKNQLKKLRKRQEWEAGREDRKAVRKQKHREKKARNRAAKELVAGPVSSTNGGTFVEGQDESSHISRRPGVPKHRSATLLPITFIIDCAFDDLMHEKERISLASQITRAYSDNHRAPLEQTLLLAHGVAAFVRGSIPSSTSNTRTGRE